MPDPDLDEQLRQFLRSTTNDRREGNTLANVRAELHQIQLVQRGLSGRVAGHDAELEEVHNRLDHHGAALVVVKRRLRSGEHDEEMDTGRYDLGAIRREVEAARARESKRVQAETDQIVWWKRSIIMWVVGGLGAVSLALMVALVTLAIASASNSRQPSTSEPRK